MTMMKLVLLVVAAMMISHVLGYGETDGSGHPNWQERANHVFANAVRISPSQYKSKYMAGYSPSPANILGSTYPARPPVYLAPTLVNAAVFHSTDMANNGCFAHDSCDGTPTFTRIGSYYTCGGGMGENIAAGNADPLDTNNQWLCDKVGSECAADGSPNDGHRKNIMSSGYKTIGTGYAANPSATYRHYWTQDFGGATCSLTSPVYGGSHRTKSGSTLFIAVYYTSPAVAPASANVVIDGTSYPLSLDIGAAGAGTYAFTQTAGTGCRSYYFTFGSIRYPDTGCLVTYGEGTCTSSWAATCSGSTPATSAPTSAPATPAPTSAPATPAPTSAPATPAPTSSPATSAPTPKPTTRPTSAPTSTPRPTNAPTSTPRPTNAPTQGSAHLLYTSALQNSWTLQFNTQVTITHSASYSGKNGLKASLGGTSGNNFIMFNHVPQVTGSFNAVAFFVAASGNANIQVYFNGGYYQTKAVTTQWQLITIPLTSLKNPSTGQVFTAFGSPNQLVFQSNSGAITLYLNNVALV